jgi:hypothetical protein
MIQLLLVVVGMAVEAMISLRALIIVVTTVEKEKVVMLEMVALAMVAMVVVVVMVAVQSNIDKEKKCQDLLY